MQHTHVVHPTQNYVRAVFTNSVAFFDIPRVASFQQLADRLSLVAEHHHGPLSRIDIQAEPHHNSGLVAAMLPRQFPGAGGEFSSAHRQ